MQATFKYDGASIDYTPTSAVTAGTPVSQSGYVGIPKTDIAANALGALSVVGVFDIVKVTGALSVGDVIGWDNDGDPVGGVAGSGAATKTLANADFVLGTVIADAVEAGAVARTQLNEFPGSKILDTFPAVAAIADMAGQTQNALTNNLSPTADTTLADITLADPLALTDSTGGTDPADGTLAAVTNTTDLTDSGAGAADGTVEDVADVALSTSDTYTDAAVNAAINTAIASISNNFKEMTTELATQRTANTAILAAVSQLATYLNTANAAIAVLEANQADVAAQLAKIKTDVAASDTKIDAILAALRSAGIIAT
jgi:predicted RecA/RadA family phage recombinase